MNDVVKGGTGGTEGEEEGWGEVAAVDALADGREERCDARKAELKDGLVRGELLEEDEVEGDEGMVQAEERAVVR